MNRFLLFFFLIILSACKNKKEDSFSASIDPGCFSFSDGKNSVYFQITDTTDGITGYLKYNLEERNNITGIFNGSLSADTLSGIFSFSKGDTINQRELIFLVKDDQLFESYGDAVVEDNYTFYKDYNSLKLIETMPLSRTECKDKIGCLTAFDQIPSILNECVLLSDLLKLNPVSNGTGMGKQDAYLLFSKNRERAEVFLPPYKTSMILVNESSDEEGLWINAGYKLFEWNGYVLQKDEVPLYSLK